MMEYNRQNKTNRKPYSKLTAQIAKNTVKKQISAIKSSGAKATDAFIDQLIETNGKKSQNAFESENPLMSEFLTIVRKNRAKWRNFIIELVGRFDADALATVGVGLVYGGVITSSVGDAGWASEIILDEKTREISADRIKKISDIISQGRNRGCFVWIIKGKGTYSPELLRLYRYNPDCVFFVAEAECGSKENAEKINKKELTGAKNVIFVLSGVEQSEYSFLNASGIPYIIDSSLRSNTSPGSSINGGYEREVMRFLEFPGFPLTFYGLSDVADIVENLLSAGKSRRIPRYTV